MQKRKDASKKKEEAGSEKQGKEKTEEEKSKYLMDLCGQFIFIISLSQFVLFLFLFSERLAIPCHYVNVNEF